jgi:presenilin-like A22 family membrane protease
VVAVSSADTETGPLAGLDLDVPPAVPGVATYLLALTAMVLGVLAAPSLSAAGVSLEHDPASGHTLLPIIVGAAAGTLTVLLVQRLGYGTVAVRALMIASWGLAAALFSRAFAPGFVVPAVLGVAVFAVMWLHPEWYVVDVAGVPFCAGVAAFFGISVVPGLLVGLLVVAAVYDAYSVYVSEHMQSLVDGSFDMNLPPGFVVPRSLDFSLRDLDDLEELSDGDESAALLGFGDALYPGMLAVSAGHFLGPGAGETLAPTLVAGLPYLNAPALGALAGGVVGMVGLHALAKYGEGTQPALVVLNPGIVGGYLLGGVAAGVPLTTALGL